MMGARTGFDHGKPVKPWNEGARMAFDDGKPGWGLTMAYQDNPLPGWRLTMASGGRHHQMAVGLIAGWPAGGAGGGSTLSPGWPAGWPHRVRFSVTKPLFWKTLI